jgi:hypothetical protein
MKRLGPCSLKCREIVAADPAATHTLSNRHKPIKGNDKGRIADTDELPTDLT